MDVQYEGCPKEDCMYRSTNYGKCVTCDYILIEKRRRGCEAGENCDKYRPGPRPNLWAQSYTYIQRVE